MYWFVYFDIFRGAAISVDYPSDLVSLDLAGYVDPDTHFKFVNCA
jgi:hypothetical protein